MATSQCVARPLYRMSCSDVASSTFALVFRFYHTPGIKMTRISYSPLWDMLSCPAVSNVLEAQRDAEEREEKTYGCML